MFQEDNTLQSEKAKYGSKEEIPVGVHSLLVNVTMKSGFSEDRLVAGPGQPSAKGDPPPRLERPYCSGIRTRCHNTSARISRIDGK